MFISSRILRRDAQRFDPVKPYPTPRDEAQRERIMAVGRGLLARHGRAAISMAGLAAALGHGAGVIRRHFPDLDALHAALIEAHLGHIRETLREIPRNLANRQAALRAAYLQATRAGPGRLSNDHLLLVRDRHLLPEDEQEPIGLALDALGALLADDLGPEALTLLDNPLFDAARVERLLATLRQEVATEMSPEIRADPPPAPPRKLPDLESCLPQGYRPEPPRRPQARDGPKASSPFLKKRAKKLLSV